MGRVLCWVGHLWTERVRFALEHYGDRITDISIFGWSVSREGTLRQTFDPSLLDPYRAKWPHIRFWGCFRNMDDPADGPRAIFDALRDSPTARARLAGEVEQMLTEYPWLSGVDIDMESGGDARSEDSEAIFRAVANRAHQVGKLASAALPPLTAEGSVGGENWVRYSVLGGILDQVAIMSYDFAWSGSAPGPVTPGFWAENVYDWATSQMPASKILMGVPLYSYFWQIHNYPEALGKTYRGDSGTFYAAWQYFTGVRAQGGTDANPDGPGTHHRIGWLAYRDPDSMSAYGFLDVYDWRHSPDWNPGTNQGISALTWDGKPYVVRYGKPSGTPLWSVADNSGPGTGADYTVTPRRVRAASGELVGPKQGFTLTAELLKRYPVAATILDDNAAIDGQLDAVYRVGSGSWSRWTNGRDYHQYRGTGQLYLDEDFTDRAIYMQIRGQWAESGWAAVTARGVTAELLPTGLLQVRQGSTVLGSVDVPARPVGAPAGSGRFVLGLRVRESTARVYFSTTENSEIPRVLRVNVIPEGGDVGITTAGTLWIDHFYVGDGWWYQPREAIEVQIGDQTRVLGRLPRSGIVWDDKNRFRPSADVDESETREAGYSLDWVFDHWVDAPFQADTSEIVGIRTIDHDVWLGRVFVCDRDGATIAYWTDPETVVHWRDRADLDWRLGGIAMWTLGQEDVRTWERLAGGELPAATKRLNA